jgi:transitional endoplasmic reticulum ATPase
MGDEVDPVPVINRSHFEEAFSAARRSVTISDLHKFEEFRKKFDPVYAKKVGGSDNAPDISLAWPEDASSQFAAQNDDDDDLYD